jgi:hypothetical protein
LEVAMPVPEQAEVKKIMGGFEARIRTVVDRAWQEWLEFPNRGRLVFINRARAVLVFDFIARIAQEEFADDPNIHVIVKRQTIQFLFHKSVLVRFKKGNAKGIGSNIVTSAVLDFVDPNRTIPGLVPDILKIEICYSPDTLGVVLDEVAVVARNEDRRIWAYPIDKASPATPVLRIPTRSPDLTPPTATPRHPTADNKTGDQE